MKKVFTKILSVAMVVCCLIGLTACDTKLAKVGVSTLNVTSNGGPVAKQGNTVYFVNGFLAPNATSNKFGEVGISSLYKVVLNNAGEMTKKDDGSIDNMTQLVSSQTGFEKGSIFVFGDYVYYATPYSGKDKTGSVLYNYLSFYRIKNDGTDRTLICTTDTADANMTYTYYVTGEDCLTLVLFEQTSGFLTSYTLTNKVTHNIIDENVVSVAFSEANGIGSACDGLVFYTKSVDKDDENQKGNKVYKVKPNGTEKTLISSGLNVDIVTICNGFLVYEEDGETRISKCETELKKTDKVISYISYSTVKYLASNDCVSMIVLDETDKNNVKIKYVDGSNPSNNYVLFEGKATIIGTDSEYLYFYDSSNYIYKVKFTEEKNDSTNNPTKICIKAVAAQNGTMVPEVVGGYVYFFGFLVGDDNKDTKTVLLYRVKCLAETAIAAELVGVSA